MAIIDDSTQADRKQLDASQSGASQSDTSQANIEQLERKQFLRRRMHQILRKTPQVSIRHESDMLCTKIRKYLALINPDYIVAYIPYKKEVDILPVLQQALQEGRQVYVPLESALERASSYVPYYARSVELVNRAKRGCGLGRGSCRSRLLTLHPYIETAWHKIFCKGGRGLVLVPGLAFDSAGTRLGRGGGYYDRLLAMCEHHQDVFCMGVCFFSQLVAPGIILTNEHDKKVKCVLSSVI